MHSGLIASGAGFIGSNAVGFHNSTFPAMEILSCHSLYGVKSIQKFSIK